MSVTKVSTFFVCTCAVCSVLQCKIIMYYPRCGACEVERWMNCMIELHEHCLLLNG